MRSATMSVLRTHIPRYVCWAMAGGFLLTVPFTVLSWRNPLDAYRAVLIAGVASVGGALLVLIRFATGLATGWPAGVADRALARWMGRFFAGCILGMWVAVVWFAIAQQYPREQHERILGRGTFFFGSVLGGAVATLFSRWAGHRRGFLFLMLAWTTAFAAVVGVWFVLSP